MQALPDEILDIIAAELSIAELLNLSATCIPYRRAYGFGYAQKICKLLASFERAVVNQTYAPLGWDDIQVYIDSERYYYLTWISKKYMESLTWQIGEHGLSYSIVDNMVLTKCTEDASNIELMIEWLEIAWIERKDLANIDDNIDMPHYTMPWYFKWGRESMESYEYVTGVLENMSSSYI